MASITGSVLVTVSRAFGGVRRLAIADMVWQRPGISGNGILQFGYHKSRFVFTVVMYSNNNGVVTTYNTINGFTGQVISVIDDWGANYTNLYLREVGLPIYQTARVPDDSYTCRGEWQIEGISLTN